MQLPEGRVLYTGEGAMAALLRLLGSRDGR
jgi:hypothetical protein